MGFNILTALILICVLLSMKAFNDVDLKNKWTFSPYRVKHDNEGGRILTHIWIHADVQHLIFNMFSLYFLGQVLQSEFINFYGFVQGQVHFLVLFLLGGLFATLIPYLRNSDNPGYRSLGASGAVSAVVFGAIIWRPDMELGLIFLPFYFKAYWFGLAYLAYEFWADKKGNTGIAHDAHIGGAFTGILYVLLINSEKGSQFFQHIFNS